MLTDGLSERSAKGGGGVGEAVAEFLAQGGHVEDGPLRITHALLLFHVEYAVLWAASLHLSVRIALSMPSVLCCLCWGANPSAVK